MFVQRTIVATSHVCGNEEKLQCDWCRRISVAAQVRVLQTLSGSSSVPVYPACTSAAAICSYVTPAFEYPVASSNSDFCPTILYYSVKRIYSWLWPLSSWRWSTLNFSWSVLRSGVSAPSLPACCSKSFTVCLVAFILFLYYLCILLLGECIYGPFHVYAISQQVATIPRLPLDCARRMVCVPQSLTEYSSCVDPWTRTILHARNVCM